MILNHHSNNKNWKPLFYLKVDLFLLQHLFNINPNNLNMPHHHHNNNRKPLSCLNML
jgi:hypothetical protein